MIHRPRAIVFDWDNTLVDSWECIQVATNATLRHMGHPEWSMDETRRRVAHSLRDAFPVLFGARWEEARDHFYATFEAVHMDYLRPLPDAREMLDALSGMGVVLAVVSNKTGRYLRAEAGRLGWEGLFHRLVGATDAPEDKPSAAPVHMALAASGIEPGPAVWFVGDAPIDMACAVNSGCLPVLLRNAALQQGEFDTHPPRRHIQGCKELAALVRDLAAPAPQVG